jgi:hypothetical protein
MEPHAPVPSLTLHPVLPLIVELSGREVEAAQVGPPLHVMLGAWVDPVKSLGVRRNYLQQLTHK